MGSARKELAGELVAYHLRMLAAAVLAPDKLPMGRELNPFRDAGAESEAMRKHRQAWERARWRGMVQGARE